MNCYPANRHPEGTIVFTQWGGLYHESVVPVARQGDAIAMALKMSATSSEKLNVLQMIMVLLSDVPAEPLLHAKSQNKASVTNLLSLGYVLRIDEHEQIARHVLAAGDGVIIVRITGDMDHQSANVGLFEDWEKYTAFLEPLMSNGRLTKSHSNSTLL